MDGDCLRRLGLLKLAASLLDEKSAKFKTKFEVPTWAKPPCYWKITQSGQGQKCLPCHSTRDFLQKLEVLPLLHRRQLTRSFPYKETLSSLQITVHGKLRLQHQKLGSENFLARYAAVPSTPTCWSWFSASLHLCFSTFAFAGQVYSLNW